MFDAHAEHRDTEEGRIGDWMQTHSGKKFFPQDPRMGDFTVGDLANGMALDCRYGGQGRIDRYYSVAEHALHMAGFALRDGKHPMVALAVLFHDAAEGLLNDLTRATKAACPDYARLETVVQSLILRKYNLLNVTLKNLPYIKELDRRMIPLEKAAVARHPEQPWRADDIMPLSDVTICCYPPYQAKLFWLAQYDSLCNQAGMIPEQWEV